MSKIFNTLATIAIASSAVLVSCGDDEPVVIDKVEDPTPQNAHYVAIMTEEFFEYGEITLTLIHDDDTTYYKMDESTKVDDIIDDTATKALFELEEKDKIPGRKIDLSEIEFYMHPVKAFLNVELTEAGKQKIANASETDEMKWFYLSSSLGEHAKGKCHCQIYDTRFYDGVYIKDLEGFLDTYLTYGKSILVRELK